MANYVQSFTISQDITAGDFVVIETNNTVKPANEIVTTDFIGIALDSANYKTTEETKIRVWIPKERNIN